MDRDPTKESRGPTESFVVFGTAFPETTERDKRAGRTDAGQFVPVWKQEARDEKGRRRFHGAFTGGFSAGYFNTVGSKEGWEPSNFISSRTTRNDKREAKPEDYMDEEDLEDMAQSRKLVATEEFDILGGTERELAARKQQLKEDEERGGVGLGSSLMNMIGPSKDSIGIRLLRKMGWKPGQGIGARTSKRQRITESDDESDDEFLKDVTFAPHDTPIEDYKPKRDTYGLGYDMASCVPEVAEMRRLRELARENERNGLEADKKKRSSFGVLNKDAYQDEEEEDVYGNVAVGREYHTTLYDEDEGGYTKDELRYKQLERERQKSSKSKKVIKCSDGRVPLKGFHISENNEQIGKWYPPPIVPSNFTGQHIIQVDPTQTKNITKDSIFSFEERAAALGEKPIEQRSVFDYIPKHSKDKLDQAVKYYIDSGVDKSQLSNFPDVSKEVAKLALRGFMPFGDNVKKQRRYKNFLENQAGLLTQDGTPKKTLPIPEGLTYEAATKELDEFAKAARIFRPISQMMSGRFTSASEGSAQIGSISFQGGLQTEEEYRKEKESKQKEMIREPEKKPVSQQEQAAAMKMFGGLTRTIKPFYPNRLVCKRFNIRNPHPDHEFVPDSAVGRTEAGSKDALSKESMETLLRESVPTQFTSSTKESSADEPPKFQSVEPEKPKTQELASHTEKKTTPDADDEGPALDYERPSMDIFKAIFDDSDSEEEEEEVPVKKTDEKKPIVTAEAKEEDFVGPLPPPKAPTLDVSLNAKPREESPSAEPFRPMFQRSLNKKETIKSTSLPTVISEEIIVQPFKSRHSMHKRRRVSISDEEEEELEIKPADQEKRSSSKHSKSSSHRSKKHHKSSRSSSRKRSPDRRRSRDRKREYSESPERRHHKKHKKSDKERSRKHKNWASEEIEGIWVEKEPVMETSFRERRDERKRSSDHKSEKRMRASDLW
ncbi:hypothetical protein BDB01DRAFT_844386 [Pilobolus umbonatus]|nr:hypothetical protein BDB01DRAFT_844386 [Pilobolus umbonatus]